MRSSAIIVAAAAALLASSCAHQAKPVEKEDVNVEYQVGVEDVLDVSVWRDADLSRTVPVRPDGRISMPLVGELQASGKTPTQIGAEIATRLEPYMQDPRVVVIVREVNAPRVYVIGEVPRPGSYPLRGRMTVLQALSLAGGPNEFADRDGIVVLRDGGRRRFEVDYETMVSTQNADPTLKPGDTIYVP